MFDFWFITARFFLREFMKFILGTKKSMTQIFSDDGDVIPVTILKAGPCPVVKIKTKEGKDGYSSVTLGLSGKKKLGKRELGQIKDLGNLEYLKEFRTEELENIKRGDMVSVTTFEVGDKVKVIGTSKGKGFQGVVKRHGFHGQSKTHGTKDQERAPGSIGPTEPARVFPGMRMPGHMGAEQVTVKNLEVAKIDEQNNELYLKGAVPGGKNGLLMISGEGELKIDKSIKQENNKTKEEEDAESLKNENTEMQEKENKEEDNNEEKQEEVKEKSESSKSSETSELNKDKEDKLENKKEEIKEEAKEDKKEEK